MAGAGYKLFNTGDVLTAAQVNTYLQEQTVMVFASSTARTTALSGVLAEGMMSYLQDTNSVEVYNGSSWVALASGDLTEIVAGTGITVTSGTGPIPTVALTTPVAATNGGTAQTTYTTGDLLYASGTNTLAKRAIGSTGNVLTVSGGLPTWAAPSTGDWVKITEIVNTSTADWTWSSIPTTYRNLIIIGYGRSNVAATEGQGFMRFNDDSGNNYDWVQKPAGVTAAGDSGAGISYCIPFATVGSTATTNNVFSFMIEIPNYKGTTFFKGWNSQSVAIRNTTAADFRTNTGGGIWRNTGAINKINLSDATGGGGFLAGSVATLYGVM